MPSYRYPEAVHPDQTFAYQCDRTFGVTSSKASNAVYSDYFLPHVTVIFRTQLLRY